MNHNNTTTPTRPPIQQNHSNPHTSLPPHMRPEIQVSASTSASTSSSISYNPASDVKGKRPAHPSGLNTPITTPLHPPAQRATFPKQEQQQQQLGRQVSFSEPDVSATVANSSVPPVKPKPDKESDDFGFNSDDDAFLALADLGPPIGAGDTDIGRPIDADAGRPIDHEEGLLKSVEDDDTSQILERTNSFTKPTPPPSKSEPSAKSRHELIAAALRGEVGDGAVQGQAPSKALASSSSFSSAVPSDAMPQQARPSTSLTPVSSSSTNSRPPPPPDQRGQNHHQTTTTSFAQHQHQRYMNQRQNQNQNPAPQNQATAAAAAADNAKRGLTPSVGGFHFPPGAVSPRSLSSVRY
ncbi:hypothetical protein GALMADRAFT_1187281 [Galerina marginata CBS 339.88]|uniref:Uncharacterized protein n=1 Tax=Galerina marginata (strain CBS 339.88) TaxID=685588 RepID=A0A067TD17_GALM3|nr:hypothetical protein GALMADRAFT_1187281 [Galerina marginata CBS 339.88]